MYSVKLKEHHGSNGKSFDSIYYTITGNKVYYEDTDAGIGTDRVTSAEMVDYAKSHRGIGRILNVAKGMQIVDMRVKGDSTTSTDNSNSKDLTPLQLGTLVVLNQSPDWFKEYLDDGTMYYGTQSDMKVGPDVLTTSLLMVTQLAIFTLNVMEMM